MSKKIKELLGLKNTIPEKLRIERPRISWDNIFLHEAVLWSARSHDAETQCGCVLVKDHTVLSTGYNGFIRDIDDSVLPNIRPHKYIFMIHAEHNAVLNCARQGKSTLGATAYITTSPCLQCFQLLWQAGIKHIIYSNFTNHTQEKIDIDKIQALLLLINSSGRKLIFKFIDKKGLI